MPVAVSYPGVYIQEVSSGVRTITGVATSITAFLGRALRGPVDEPVTITSFADFERLFGGLWIDSSLGFAVRDFYLNGGSRAIIVRLYAPPAAVDGVVHSNAAIAAGTLNLQARYPGVWGNALQVRIDHKVTPDSTTTFNLSVRDARTGQIEVFRNVSVAAASPRRVDSVLASESRLIVATGALPAERPAKNPDLTAGQDDVWNPALATNTRVLDAGKAADELALNAASFNGPGTVAGKRGLYALAKADLFNILCIPPYLVNDGDMLNGTVDASLTAEAAVYCEKRRAMLIVDAPPAWDDAAKAEAGVAAIGTTSKNAALFFPRLREAISLRDGQIGTLAACGAVAGIFARTDTERGVWKAPAGMDATLVGVPALSVALNDAENGLLNPLGINCLRTMPAAGRIVWGARTLQGDDRLASEWKYIPVRRTALYIEESLYRGTQWVVFEPNDEPLWAQIRLNLGAFMHNLFRQGAFQGKTPQEAYFVKCDKETTPQDDINRGIVNIVVGFAPLKPAEFVVITLQQIAGQIQA